MGKKEGQLARFNNRSGPWRGGGGDAIALLREENDGDEKRREAKREEREEEGEKQSTTGSSHFRVEQSRLLTQLLARSHCSLPREERTARDTMCKLIMHVSRRLVSISFPVHHQNHLSPRRRGALPPPAEQFINPCLFTPFPTGPLRVWPASTVRLVVGWSRLARSGKQLLRHQKPATADTRLPCLGQASLSILMQEQNWLVLMSLLSYFSLCLFLRERALPDVPGNGGWNDGLRCGSQTV